MKIWHLSDTHNKHFQIPFVDCDLFIFTGDATLSHNHYHNEKEYRDFLNWVKLIPAKHKIIIAGNHDVSIERGLIDKESFDNVGVIYLEDDMIKIKDVLIYGNPFSPKFGEWSFMKEREKFKTYWKRIPECDILLTHSPAKGILDLAYGKELLHVGCEYLLNEIYKKGIKHHLFGHIHNNYENINSGVFIKDGVTFSNASCVTDGYFERLPTEGNIINI